MGKGKDEAVNSQSVAARVVDEQGGTALPTAMLTVKSNVKGHKSHVIRCFFDTGSQRSFVHPEVMEQLGLYPNDETVISLNAFGHSAEPLTCPVLRLRLALGNRVAQVNFLVTDKVDVEVTLTRSKESRRVFKLKGSASGG